MNPRKITSLEELRHAKRVLQLKQEVTKREFAHSLGTTRDNLGNVLLKKVVLPVGGVLLAKKGISMAASNRSKNKADQYQTEVHQVGDKQFVVQQNNQLHATAKKSVWLPVLIQLLRTAAQYHQTGNGLLASLMGHKPPKPEANAEVVATPEVRHAVTVSETPPIRI